MTTTKSNPTNVVVVDGSNIATEGRSMPSLAQLNDAVMAFREEFPDAVVTVVVDATFGHRIDKKEQAEFDAAVAHNELVAPPAGAIGRGDAFVLSIANKVGARILSNDSFQEFHGDYPWLFDEGRLIGGKPVPFVGWVFVERLPVKGPVSRKAQRAARGGRTTEPRTSRRSASREASLPMPVPSAPPPSARRAATATADAGRAPAGAATAKAGAPVNELLPFLDFVEHHPVGSSVNGVVESYSSHGAYVSIGDIRGYVPLRLMGEPTPRSAREVMKIGDAVTLVVNNFAPARRSIDLATPHVAPAADVVPTPALDELVEAVAPARRTTKRAAKQAVAEPAAEPSSDGAKAAPAGRTRRTAKQQAAAPDVPAASATTETPAQTASGDGAAPARRGRRTAAPSAAADTGAAPAPGGAVPAPEPGTEPAAPSRRTRRTKQAATSPEPPADAAPVAPTDEPPEDTGERPSSARGRRRRSTDEAAAQAPAADVPTPRKRASRRAPAAATDAEPADAAEPSTDEKPAARSRRSAGSARTKKQAAAEPSAGSATGSDDGAPTARTRSAGRTAKAAPATSGDAPRPPRKRAATKAAAG